MHAHAHTHSHDEHTHAPDSEPAEFGYTVSSGDIGALIVGVPGAMAIGFVTSLLAVASSGGFAGIAWILGLSVWLGFAGVMGALWFASQR